MKPTRRLTYAVDYDHTFTADPEATREMVANLQRRGHVCVLVTGRSDDNGWGDAVRRDVGTLMPIVFAGGTWKRDAAARAGYPVDIWIDDSPEGIRPADVAMVEMRNRATYAKQRGGQ